MTDVGFVIAGYGVILGALAAYSGLLLLRLRRIRQRTNRRGDGNE